MAVMLRSAMTHLPADRRLVAHVFDGGLEEIERERVRRSVGDRVRLEWHDPDRSRLSGLPLWGHVSAATYYRLLLEGSLPRHLSRVVWLDCDLLVLDDLSAIFDASMDGALVLAARDPLVRTVSSPFGLRAYRALGLTPETPYFNAGVMVIDLAAWRQERVERRAFEYLHRHAADVFFNDQEALNAVLAHRWRTLPARWNWSTHPLHAPPGGLENSAPAILHFTGRRKPWIHGGIGPWYARYLEELDATEWRGERPALGRWRRLLLWYEQSRLRRLTYPAENLGIRIRRRALTRRLG